MELSAQQGAALAAVERWSKEPRGAPVFRVHGYAGTGKTTLIRRVVEEFGADRVLVGAYTGKAAGVLRSKGVEMAQTIHKLAYRVKGEKRHDRTLEYEPVFSANEYVEDGYRLIVLDECSMVEEQMARDLLALRLPILVFGDPAQLPPVKGTGFFTDSPEYPADRPDVMLTEVHRQARESPVLRAATAIREGRDVPFGRWTKEQGSLEVVRCASLATFEVPPDAQVICGRNATRSAHNARVRRSLGRGELPEDGDRLICLRNNHRAQLLNGELCTALGSDDLPPPDEDQLAALVTRESAFQLRFRKDDGEELARIAWRGPFRGENMALLPFKVRQAAEEFDFAYAITCHKAQGSQWDRVVVFDERSCFRAEAQRWAYTAVTRAAKDLVIVR